MTNRINTKKIFVGDIQIGGNNEVIIQSMCTTKTSDVSKTVEQILQLENAGCQIVRVACPKIEDAYAIKEIKNLINIPIVADIHFDHKIALAAIESGVDKIRINPGNIGDVEKVRIVAEKCKENNIPIRIGVNGGSLEKSILKKYGHPTPEAMVQSAKFHVSILEELNFYNIIISIKASDIATTIKAYELASEEFDYPLHLGVTEAGTSFGGTIKSCAGLSVLLHQNIGSTIRVSLSDNPVEEIKVAKELLKNFNLISNVATLISCPTCGRIEVDMIPIAKEIEEFLFTINAPIKVAVLGCAVNGPGEAKEADVGIACGKNEGLLIKNGIIVKKYPEDEIIDALKKEIKILENEYLNK